MNDNIKEIIAERIKYHSNKQKYGYFIGNACIDICASDILEDVKRAGYQKIDGDTSDGYHTFNELYHHRAVLFAMICNQNKEIAWKSKKHSDGTMFDNMFIVGIETPAGQATYHYDIEPYWDYFNVKELDNAPLWDGHTADQAIERIRLMADDAPIVCTKAEVVKEFAEKLLMRLSDYIMRDFEDGVPYYGADCEQIDDVISTIATEYGKEE